MRRIPLALLPLLLGLAHAAAGAEATKKTAYALSPVSVAVARSLPDTLLVKLYLSKELPAPLAELATFTRELLGLYHAAAPARFTWVAIDPGLTPETDDDVEQCGIRANPLPPVDQRDESRLVSRTYHFGICLTYGDQLLSIPAVEKSEGLEYEVTRRIEKMTRPRPIIAFTVGHGEFEPEKGFRTLVESLKDDYLFTTVNPSTTSIGSKVKVLVVGGPGQTLDEKGRRAIEGFLQAGKAALFLLPATRALPPDPKRKGKAGLKSTVVPIKQNGLEGTLEAYGFRIGSGVVVDEDSTLAGVMERDDGRRVLAYHPMYLGLALRSEPDLRLLDDLHDLVLPMASPVESVADPRGLPAGTSVWQVAASPPKSWVQSKSFTLDGKPTEPEGANPERHSRILGYAYEGPPQNSLTSSLATDKSTAQARGNVRMVVMGNAAFVSDEFLSLARLFPKYRAGLPFVTNALLWMTEDDELAKLRHKGADTRSR